MTISMPCSNSPAGDWQYVCQLDDITPLGARVLEREQGPGIALFRTASDQVFALLDRCPHRGGPLSQGIVHGERVTCPLHSVEIALDGGRAQPPDEGCAAAFAVHRDGTALYLLRDEIATLGTDADGVDGVAQSATAGTADSAANAADTAINNPAA